MLLEFGIMVQKNVNGWILGRYVPWHKLAAVTLAMAGISWLSAIYPARLGAKVNPVEALRSE